MCISLMPLRLAGPAFAVTERGVIVRQATKRQSRLLKKSQDSECLPFGRSPRYRLILELTYGRVVSKCQKNS